VPHRDWERWIALALVITGLIRVLAWTVLIGLYLVGVPFTTALFKSVAFVALISLYANAATDFGQVCASLAQFSASHVERARGLVNPGAKSE
jgi:cytochrome bd-type quinol oxidase subunit 2